MPFCGSSCGVDHDDRVGALGDLQRGAGVGAFRLGLEQALGRERVRTVYANDNSKLACDWYRRYVIWYLHLELDRAA